MQYTRNPYDHLRTSVITSLLLILILGSCEMDDEYSDPRERIEGQWVCTEESQQYGSSSYTVYIDLYPDDSSLVRIENFYNLSNLDALVYARMSGNILTLLNQAVSGKGSDWIITSGRGIISGNNREIDWQYSIDDGSGEIDNITATYTKQY